MNEKRSLLEGIRDIFRGGRYESVKPAASDRLRLSGKSLRVAYENASFCVEMGKQTVHVCPDLPLGMPEAETAPDFLVYDPERVHGGIAHSIRLKPGETVAIDHRQEHQRIVFSHPKDAFRRHLQISHKGTDLEFRDPISELGTYLSILDSEQGGSRLQRERNSRVERIRELYGGPVAALEPDTALALIRDVNQLLTQDPFRTKDGEGNPGGLIELPREITPIIVGDLHAQVDNLLTILTENAFLDSLERGDAALVFLGDAVHLESPDVLGKMDSSVLIMDLVLKLKQRFPERVFFIVGNHDSFSPEVMKGGVPQSVLWEKKLRECRGDDYVREMALFYQLSPLAILTEDLLACHAGPPRAAVSTAKLIEVRQFPELVHELTWNRLKSRNWPMGYGRGQVKRFRKSLGLEDTHPFIVAHYPQSAGETLWLDAGEIPNHHIVFSARPDRVGLFTRVDGELLAQIYPARQLLDVINR